MSKINILIPVYNDWSSVFKLLENINIQIDGLKHQISVLIINDASTEDPPINDFNLKNIHAVKVINMKENRGHGRCNAAGLKYIDRNHEYDYIIPMDGDGEDRPEELNLLINKVKDYPDKVVTANRIKRSEGPIFKFCYIIHKYLTLIFTGQSIKFGNYTCLPKLVVKKMINESATWSRFSGSLAKIAKDRESIPSERGERYFGPSKMSFFNLLKHSLSFIAVFKLTLLIRSILFLMSYLFLMIEKLSFITLMPVIAVIIMIFSVFALSKRESISEFNNSLENIKSINKIK